MHALWNQRFDVARLLINKGMHQATIVNTMIYFRKGNHHNNYLKQLNSLLEFKGFNMSSKFNNWPLIIDAASNDIHNREEYCGQADILYALLSHGADPNARSDGLGLTPLMLLCKNKSCKSCIRLLLKHGADIEATDDLGMRAVAYAVETGNVDAVQVLLEHKASTGVMFGKSTLIELAKKDFFKSEIVRLLRIQQNP